MRGTFSANPTEELRPGRGRYIEMRGCREARQDLNPRGLVAGRRLAILWSPAQPRCSAPVRARRGRLPDRLRCSSGHTPTAYFAAVLAYRRRLRMMWDMLNRSIFLQARNIRHLMRASCMFCQKSFRNQVECVRKCKGAWACQRLAAVRSWFLPQDAHIRDLRVLQGNGFARPV
jgi:hypothetical protein